MAIALVALSFLLGLQVIRVLFPLLFSFGEDHTFRLAGALALGLFAAPPLLASPLRRSLGLAGAIWFAVGGLVLTRVGLQLVGGVRLWLPTLGTVFALLSWTLLLGWLKGRGRGGAQPFVLGLVLGLALDTALRAAFLTWDYAWRPGAGPALLALVVGVAAVLALVRVTGEVAEDARPAGAASSIAMSPFVMLHVLFLSSPAFVASQGETSLPMATSLVLVGDALALVAVWGIGRGPVSTRLALLGGAGLSASALLLRAVAGPREFAVIIAGHVFAAILLAAALQRGGRPATWWRMSLASAGSWFLFLLLVLLYQYHYEQNLPFPNTVLAPAAALILTVWAFPGSEPGAPSRRGLRVAALPLLLLVIPAVLRVAWPPGQAIEGDGRSLRLLSYNIHMGVDTEGQVDLDAIADTIQAQDPDVVVLQEVARGWPVSGMTDVLAFLSHRLGMSLAYVPSADVQFGNAIFTRLSVAGWRWGKLPKAGGTMRRSYVWFVIDVGGGRTVNVIGTHLQHGDDQTPTRLKQIEVLLHAWDRVGRTVIAGDMNGVPGSEEFRRFVDAGLVSAQDSIGDPSLPTSWQDGTRVDYVFATDDLELSDFARPLTLASDHLPLAVTVSVG